jgi:hypothetical protein
LDPDSDPTAVERAIATSVAAWGKVHGSSDWRILEGIGLLYARHKGAINSSDLVQRLSIYPGGPFALLGKARALHEMLHTRVPHALAEIITEVYNKYRKTSALPPWRS